jgi:hypothetical protein
MGSYKHAHAFGPLDLEIIDRVYEATWAQIEARYLYRDRGRDETRQKALRRWLFALAAGGPVEFDTLCDKVIASLPKNWSSAEGPPSSPQVGSQVGDASHPDEIVH